MEYEVLDLCGETEEGEGEEDSVFTSGFSLLAYEGTGEGEDDSVFTTPSWSTRSFTRAMSPCPLAKSTRRKDRNKFRMQTIQPTEE